MPLLAAPLSGAKRPDEGLNKASSAFAFSNSIRYFIGVLCHPFAALRLFSDAPLPSFLSAQTMN
jgi:hypothetical protein